MLSLLPQEITAQTDNWPASSPIVVAVGGTTLNLNTDGTVISEIAWSGSGGGVSRYELYLATKQLWSYNWN